MLSAITVATRTLRAAAAAISSLTLPVPTDVSPETAIETIAGFVELYNKLFETYGRTVDVEPYIGTGAGDDVAYRYVSGVEAQIAEKSGRVPNVDPSGNPRSVFYSPDRYDSAAEAERALRMGRHNPAGPTASPTHRITVGSRRANWGYGGNVEGGSGIELLTDEALSVLRVEALEIGGDDTHRGESHRHLRER